ncbi:MAG: hypothetical protein MJA83_05635 [Gammaproteobacteria bacterium]|nr:hypothetical protein [Gammaproteobacteria bacterium]
MAVTVRELVVKLGFATDKKSVDRTTKTINNVKTSIGLLAGALVGGKIAQGLNSIVRNTAALGDQLDKTAEKLGVTTDALQELRFAAGQTGVQERTLDMALQRFTRRAAEAARGTGEARDALSQMGISLRDEVTGNLRPTDQLLGDVAEAMRSTTDDGERLRLAFKLFDSEGAALVNTLKGGRGALEALRAQARATGGILDRSMIQMSVQLTDTMGEFRLAMRGVRNIIAKELIPAFTGAARGIIDWVKQNRKLLQQRLGSFFRGFVGFVRRIGRFFSQTAEDAARLLEKLTPLQTKLLKFSAIIGGIALTLALAMASPVLAIGLIGLAIAAVIDDFQTWREGGSSVIGFLENELLRYRDKWPLLNDAVLFSGKVVEAWGDIINSVLRFAADVSVKGFGDAVEERFSALGVFARDVARLISVEFSELADGVMAFFQPVTEFLNGIFEQISSVFSQLGENPIVQAIVGAVRGGGEGGETAQPAIVGAARVLTDTSVTGAITGAPAVASGAMMSGPTVVNRNRADVNVTVVAPQGVDAERVAEIADERVRESIDETLRFGMEDFGVVGEGG